MSRQPPPHEALCIGCLGALTVAVCKWHFCVADCLFWETVHEFNVPPGNNNGPIKSSMGQIDWWVHIHEVVPVQYQSVCPGPQEVTVCAQLRYPVKFHVVKSFVLLE